ncbi:MAG TPA: peptide chain release factor 1 [Trueperaceae bacterium]|nr:peptide chain release factor 1 [Trueperaceae bacterium]
MLDKLKTLKDEFDGLEQSLGDPELINDQNRYKKAMQRYSELTPIVKSYLEYANVFKRMEEAKELLSDEDMAEMAKEELEICEKDIVRLESQLEKLLLPKDPYDDKNVIVEIRAAAGGDEASLFSAEVLNMYMRYASELGFKTDILDSFPNNVGGFNKVSFEVHGRGAYSKYKYESGVHRVQRIPQTETQGRVHTSTITVAVLPEADDDHDINLSPSDYRVDVFRASGPGGQSVNTTDSAVRIVYKEKTADEIVVTCQDGKSQHKNKEKALTVLRARLLERERARAQAEQRDARLVQIGTGDRSEKIRTYNFPQSRVTDHRIGYTTHNLADIMAGKLSEVTEALVEAEQLRLLEEIGSSGQT